MKRFLLIFLFLITFSFISHWLYEEVTGDFQLNNITFDAIPDYPETAINTQKQQFLDHLFEQPFYYLGKGHQTFVFSSADDKHVLKFFRFKRLKPSPMIEWLTHLPIIGPYAQKYEDKRIRRLQKLFRGPYVAYHYDSEHTAMHFIHLKPSFNQFPIISVFDWFGFEHRIPLDDVVFVVQSRAEMTKSRLARFVTANDLESIQKHIQALKDMYQYEFKLGVIDQDHNILENTGFIGNKPVRLDVGQLDLVSENDSFEGEWGNILEKRLIPWAKKHSFELKL